jgi:MoxR-like ATPase
LRRVDFSQVRAIYLELVHRLRHAGIAISDRRAVKLQRLQAASALLCGRFVVSPTDLWILRYIWDTEEQQEVIATIVQEAVNRHLDDGVVRHPRAQGNEVPNAEELARDLERLDARINGGDLSPTIRVYLRDQLGVLSGRVPWVADSQQRSFLEEKLERLWERIGRPG